MSKTLRTVALAVVVVMIAASCSSSDESSDSSTDSAPATAAPATDPPATDPPPTDPPATDPPATDPPQTDPPATDPPATDPPATDPPPTDPPDLPPTPVVAVLDRGYNFSGGDPDPDALPAQPGEVEAHWYSSGEVLAVVYVGLSDTIDACPGNSLRTASGFSFVSNAPLPNGVCDDFPTLINNTPNQGVQLCAGRVSYLSLIPTGTVGTLFASVERPDPDVSGVGITGLVELTDPSVLPGITREQLAC
jgi:hypothetical protein